MKIYTNIDSKEIYSKFTKTYTETTQEEADILLLGIETFDASELKAKYVVCPCTNTNHIKLNPSQTLVSLNGMDLSGVRSTAEHTIYLMLAIAKTKPLEFNQPFVRPKRPSTLLSGKKLGIIGYGRVGKQIKDMAESFNMYVWTCDIKSPTYYEDFSSIINSSDFIAITASISPDQKPILSKHELGNIKDGAYIINTSRGEAVDEAHILKHIKRLGGYATDVISNNGDSRHLNHFLGCSNVIVTPHVGGYTEGDMARTSAYCYGKLQDKLSS